MSIRRVSPAAPVTSADTGRYALCLPNDALSLFDGPWEITGLKQSRTLPLVELMPVDALTDNADGPTLCSPDTVLFVVDTLAEVRQMLALNRSQVQQSETALRLIRERVGEAVARTIREASAMGPAATSAREAHQPAGKRSKTIKERLLDAETRANHWLADGNEASERGDNKLAEACYDKAQYWTDRANLLAGRGDREPPKK